MAKFTIETTQEEQEAVLKALKLFVGEVLPISKLASAAGMPQSRARYAILDLVEAGKIERIPVKAYNARYIRYTYRIL